MFDRSLFIFHRSLRLDDNIALIHALQQSKLVLPIFILTQEQLGKNNDYRSNNCIQFMIESLEDLNDQLHQKGSRLFLFHGNQYSIIKKLIKDQDIQAVYINRDYTPYAVNRESEIQHICNKHHIDLFVYDDILLNPIGSTMTNNNMYQKFTPYYNASKKLKIQKPSKNNKKNYYSSKHKIKYEYTDNLHNFYKYNPNIWVRGGRKNALATLKYVKNQNKYNTDRDMLTYDTTYLSAYNKFGCISIREVYYTFKKYLNSNNKLFVQLYWRDFYYNIAYYYPHIFKGPMKLNYNKIKWNKNKKLFEKWCLGITGFPIIDASMRQLNTTGFMHNRARLITSNFLVKILGINWQWGEKYFAQQLVDYDPSQNNGGWQWSASSGVDSQPYFRIFNPWLQSKKYDPDCSYIKLWIPELYNISPNDIHTWYKSYSNIKYPKPMVDYAYQADKIQNLYSSIF